MSPISSRNSVPRWASSSSPILALHRAGEGAALVAEQLGFQQLARQSGAVEIDERFLRPRAVGVQPARPARPCRSRSRRGGTPDARPPRPGAPARPARRMAGLVPTKGSHRPPLLPRLPGQLLLPVALVLEAPRRSRPGAPAASTGLVRKCSAPSFMAWTASSTEPWAVSRMTGTCSAMARSRGSKLQGIAIRQPVVAQDRRPAARCGRPARPPARWPPPPPGSRGSRGNPAARSGSPGHRPR